MRLVKVMGDLEILPKGLHIKVKFVKPDDYKTHFINGVYGGITPQGEVHCNFFFEHLPLPETEELVVADKGQLTPIKEKDKGSPKHQTIRDLKAGVIMTPIQARAIAKWLNDKVDEYEAVSQLAIK